MSKVSFKSYVCRLHVILRHLTRHKPEERFYPAIQIVGFVLSVSCFWLLIALNFLGIDFVVTQPQSWVIIFLASGLTAVLLRVVYKAVGDANRYAHAEAWFAKIESGRRTRIMDAVGVTYLMVFCGSLFLFVSIS